MNDNDREQWVSNDEGLYDMQRRSGMPKWKWIRANRKLIDEAVGLVTTGNCRQHYLKYG